MKPLKIITGSSSDATEQNAQNTVVIETTNAESSMEIVAGLSSDEAKQNTRNNVVKETTTDRNSMKVDGMSRKRSPDDSGPAISEKRQNTGITISGSSSDAANKNTQNTVVNETKTDRNLMEVDGMSRKRSSDDTSPGIPKKRQNTGKVQPKKYQPMKRKRNIISNDEPASSDSQNIATTTKFVTAAARKYYSTSVQPCSDVLKQISGEFCNLHFFIYCSIIFHPSNNTSIVLVWFVLYECL